MVDNKSNYSFRDFYQNNKDGFNDLKTQILQAINSEENDKIATIKKVTELLDAKNETFASKFSEFALGVANGKINEDDANTYLINSGVHENTDKKIDHFLSQIKSKDVHDLKKATLILALHECVRVDPNDKTKQKKLNEAVLIGCMLDDKVQKMSVDIINEFYMDDYNARVALYNKIINNNGDKYGYAARGHVLNSMVSEVLTEKLIDTCKMDEAKTKVAHVLVNSIKDKEPTLQAERQKQHEFYADTFTLAEKLIVCDWDFRAGSEFPFANDFHQENKSLSVDKREKLEDFYTHILTNHSQYSKIITRFAFNRAKDFIEVDESYKPVFEKVANEYFVAGNKHVFSDLSHFYRFSCHEDEKVRMNEEIKFYKRTLDNDKIIFGDDDYKGIVRRRLREIGNENPEMGPKLKRVLCHEAVKETNSNDRQRYALETMSALGWTLDNQSIALDLMNHADEIGRKDYAEKLIESCNRIGNFQRGIIEVCKSYKARTESLEMKKKSADLRNIL